MPHINLELSKSRAVELVVFYIPPILTFYVCRDKAEAEADLFTKLLGCNLIQLVRATYARSCIRGTEIITKFIVKTVGLSWQQNAKPQDAQDGSR